MPDQRYRRCGEITDLPVQFLCQFATEYLLCHGSSTPQIFAQFQTGPSYGAGRTRSAVQEKHAVRGAGP